MRKFIETTELDQRGTIAKINQSGRSIAGPIFSKYWTGHVPKDQSRMISLLDFLVQFMTYVS